MARASVPFDKRLQRIVRHHDRKSNGVVKTVTSNGLIVERPRVYRPRFPLKGLLAVIVIGFLFKGFVFANLGEAQYAERVAVLKEGTVMEQVGAWVMQADPATVMIAGGVRVILP